MPRRRGMTGAAAGLALAVVTGAALVVAAAAVGAAVPGLGRLSQAATYVAPTLAPALAVLGLVTTALAWALRRRYRRWGTAVTVVAAAGTAAMVVLVAQFTIATTRAGGSIDLLRAVVPTSPATATADEQVVYATTADGRPLSAAVYRPAPGPPAPVLVYLHGGGWSGGSERDRSGDLRWFAERGWLVVSVGYSLATPERPTWDVAGPEVGCALGWVAARAGGDPSRLAVAGDSAGGQLAVSVAYAAAAGTATSSCGGRVPVPRGVAVQYPPVDMVGAYRNGFAFPGLDARLLGRTYTGGSPEEVPERYRAVSGEPAISPAAPPTLLLSPTRDDLVPADGVARFAAAASAAGVDSTLVALPSANHSYDSLAEGSLGNQARRTITLAWLDDRVRAVSPR